ncbi:hypothetical protein [Actinomadura rugatobispora]|uniref:SWIM-type domain-containing protein n=1 Tax=Actinomadura rugatobispora TaxID=1994 RepID=A0ABW0ZSZ8_9ACTN|nr:hypothetical protein GCM10010200_036260 [Actinomadura rugatobispora]
MAKAITPKTATCKRCKATLRSATSIARGMGAHCARMARKEAALNAAGYKPTAIAKARELIADGGIVPIRGRRVFRAVSTDGQNTYLTAPQGCTCKAGLKGRHLCFHRAAATLLAA